MSLYTSQVLFSLVSPLGVGLIVAVSGVIVALCTNYRKSAWGCVLFGILWVWFWSMPITVGVFRSLVVADNIPKALNSLPRAQAIVVLGGGVVSSGMDDAIKQPFDLQEAADRVWYGGQLYKAGLAPWVLLSGGNQRNGNLKSSEAAVMKEFLVDLGVPSKAIVLEAKSRNTLENAYYSAQILKRLEIQHILLVTSATHMGRALSYFENNGLTVTPAPTDYKPFRPLEKQCCLPDPHTLVINSQLMKELAGKYLWPLLKFEGK